LCNCSQTLRYKMITKNCQKVNKKSSKCVWKNTKKVSCYCYSALSKKLWQLRTFGGFTEVMYGTGDRNNQTNITGDRNNQTNITISDDLWKKWCFQWCCLVAINPLNPMSCFCGFKVPLPDNRWKRRFSGYFGSVPDRQLLCFTLFAQYFLLNPVVFDQIKLFVC
jgi:hypothetical protein